MFRPATRQSSSVVQISYRSPHRRFLSSKVTPPALKYELRELLRETAQPVAVLTSFFDKKRTNPPDSNHVDSTKFHGATLSSFTSIAFDPHPLVAFSLRTPSRMATALKSFKPDFNVHMVINILSSKQTTAALRFSRPDLYAQPFRSLPYTLTKEGLPTLTGAVGAISCTLMSWFDLHDMQLAFGDSFRCSNENETPLKKHEVNSELFIARVMRVEEMKREVDDHPLPLLYRHRQYTTVAPLETTLKLPEDIES